jgi:hypothetical protein
MNSKIDIMKILLRISTYFIRCSEVQEDILVEEYVPQSQNDGEKELVGQYVSVPLSRYYPLSSAN